MHSQQVYIPSFSFCSYVLKRHSQASSSKNCLMLLVSTDLVIQALLIRIGLVFITSSVKSTVSVIALLAVSLSGPTNQSNIMYCLSFRGFFRKATALFLHCLFLGNPTTVWVSPFGLPLFFSFGGRMILLSSVSIFLESDTNASSKISLASIHSCSDICSMLSDSALCCTISSLTASEADSKCTLLTLEFISLAKFHPLG